MKLAALKDPCDRCGWRDRDALHYCSPCRRVLVHKLDLPYAVRQDIRRSLPLEARGDRGTRLTIVPPQPEATAPIDPNAPRCFRCTDKPRRSDSAFCDECLPSVLSAVARTCRHCREQARYNGMCENHWLLYGRRGPSGDG